MTDSNRCINAEPPASREPDIARRDQSIGIQLTNEGVLHPEIPRHYLRIRPPTRGESLACENCCTETIQVNNQPPGTRTEFEAWEIVDAGFLELVRYGVRRADNPLIVHSLQVVDAVLKRELPQGPGWLRYNWDGYG